jgi:hypothetical protein
MLATLSKRKIHRKASGYPRGPQLKKTLASVCIHSSTGTWEEPKGSSEPEDSACPRYYTSSNLEEQGKT